MRYLLSLVIMIGILCAGGPPEPDPRAYSGLVHPTGITLPPHSFYFGLYDGQIITAGYAVTKNTHIGLGLDTPLYSTTVPFVGFKSRMYHDAESAVAASVMYKYLDWLSFFSTEFAYSIIKSRGMHTFTLGQHAYFFSGEFYSNLLLLYGLQVRAVKKVILLLEGGVNFPVWASTFANPVFRLDPEADFNGGIRFIHRGFSIDAGYVMEHGSHGTFDLAPRINLCYTYISTPDGK